MGCSSSFQTEKMVSELLEMRKLQKSLPPRPSFSQLEWALSTIGRVNSNLGARRDDLDRQPRPAGVPASVFGALQEMRREILEEEARQQRQQAEAVSRLEQRHRLYDAWIQLAYDAMSSSLSLTSCSSPTAVAAAPGPHGANPSNSNAPNSNSNPPNSNSILPNSNSNPPNDALISPYPAEGSSRKSAPDTKRDLFPSEGSTTSATQVSSAALAPPTVAGEEQADSPRPSHQPVAEEVTELPRIPSPSKESMHCSADRRGCSWSEHETFMLIDGKRKLAEDMRASPSSPSFKSKQKRWEYVAGILESFQVHKTWQQCVYKWNRLWKPFKAIHGHEKTVVFDHLSYWELNSSERVKKRLPRNYSFEIFDMLKQNFVNDRSSPSNITIEAANFPLRVHKNEALKISIKKDDSNGDVSPTLNDMEHSPSKEKKIGKKRKSSGWLDDIPKDSILHRFVATSGVRLSSCMLAAWDF